MARTPARQTTIRAEAEAPTHGRVRLRKNASARSILDLPFEVVAGIKNDYGADLQWVTYEVIGKSEPQMRQDFEINGWQAVTQDMFGGILDGMYMKRGEKGEITYSGLVLMERPYELTEEARLEERKARNSALEAQQRMITGGHIPGLTPGFESDHPTALPKNVFRRSMEIPTE